MAEEFYHHHCYYRSKCYHKVARCNIDVSWKVVAPFDLYALDFLTFRKIFSTGLFTNPFLLGSSPETTISDISHTKYHMISPFLHLLFYPYSLQLF